MEKIIDATSAVSKEQMKIVGLAAANAKNSLLRRCGCSPFMAAYGRQPRLPNELLSDEAVSTHLLNMEQDEVLQFADQCRMEAMKAFAETAASTQLRNAILRQTRRVPDDYLPGQKVGFWRTQGRQGNRRKAGGATMRPG